MANCVVSKESTQGRELRIVKNCDAIILSTKCDFVMFVFKKMYLLA